MDLSRARPPADQLFCADTRLHSLDCSFDKRLELSFDDFDDTKAERACRLLCQRVRRDKELQVHFLQHFASEDAVGRLLAEKKFALLLASVVRLLLDYSTVQEQTALMRRLKDKATRLELGRQLCATTAFEAIEQDVRKAQLDPFCGFGRNSDFCDRPAVSSELRRKPISARSTANVSRECLKAKMRRDFDSFKLRYLPHYDVDRIRKATEDAERESQNRRSTSRKSKKHEPVLGKPHVDPAKPQAASAQANPKPLPKTSDLALVSLNSEVNISIPPSLFLAKHSQADRFESLKEPSQLPPAADSPNLHNSEKFIRLEENRQPFCLGLSDRAHRSPPEDRLQSSQPHKPLHKQASNLLLLDQPLQAPNYSIKPLKKLSQKKSLQRLQQQASLPEQPRTKPSFSQLEGLRSSGSLV